MAFRLRSDSLHPCHHLSEPLRNIFWCRHCMKIFTHPIDRWRHSKTCRDGAENSEEGGVSKQVSLKEGTLFRFGVWDTDPVISRPKSKSASQYGIRLPGTGKVASHRGTVNPQNFDLQCFICRQPFQSIDEMRIHVKTPCSKPPDVQNVNRFPPEITNVIPSKPPLLQKETCVSGESISSTKNKTRLISQSPSKEKFDLFASSPQTSIWNQDLVMVERYDETDGLPLLDVFPLDDSHKPEEVSLPEVGATEVPQKGNTEVPQMGNTEVPEVGDTEVPEVGDTEVPQMGNAKVTEMANTEVLEMSDTEVPEMGNTEMALDDRAAKNTVSCASDVHAGLVKLDGKIPTLQLSPVNVPSLREVTLNNTPETTETHTLSPEKSLKRKSSGDVCPVPLKSMKEEEKQITTETAKAIPIKKSKRKRVFKKAKKKKAVNKNVSVTPGNEERCESLVKSDSGKMAPNTILSELDKPAESAEISTIEEAENRSDKDVLAQTVKILCSSVKKLTPRKPPRPRKCKICGRFYKSLEQLQRHNRLPCRVKLTRNVCAKVLRSNSQTSENGMILQRRNSARSKPIPPKIIPKRRQKKRVKKRPPPFRGNPMLPQYRLVFNDLSEKEQFFFVLNMVPREALNIPVDSAIVKTDLKDDSAPPLDEEVEDLSPIEVGDLFLSDEHVPPPQLEKIDSVITLAIDDAIEDLEPPKLEMISPSNNRHFMDMVSPSAEKCLKSVFSRTPTGHKRKPKRGHVTSRARKDRYSILHPIAVAAEKQNKIKKGNKTAQPGHRASQRLKEKALLKVSQDKLRDEDMSSEGLRDAKEDEGHIKRRKCQQHVHHNERLKGGHIENIASSQQKAVCSCQLSRDSCRCGSKTGSPVSSPRKSLFESLSDISQYPGVAISDSNCSPSIENQNKLLENFSAAKSRLGKILSPVKSKKVENPTVNVKAGATTPLDTVSAVKFQPAKSKTRKRKHKPTLGESTAPCKSVSENGVSDIGLGKSSIEKQNSKQTEQTRSLPANRLKLARRNRFPHSEHETMLENSKPPILCTNGEEKKPVKQIRFPLLASRGVPRQMGQSPPKSVSREKPFFMKKVKEDLFDREVGETGMFCLVPKQGANQTAVKQIPSGVSLSMVTGFVDIPCHSTSSHIGTTVSRKALARAQLSPTNLCTSGALLPSSTSCSLGNYVQDALPIESSKVELSDMSSTAAEEVNGCSLQSTEKVTVEYIDQVTSLINLPEVNIIGNESLESLIQPEGVGDLGYLPVLDETHQSDTSDMDTTTGIHTIEPQFQTIQFS
ncbi:uncharacterized protein LOC135468038 [Liolophura sinensis]|uniref:uncharacterized protein LOC135468038 n=1 Tax=Liolophura sinensis TaxID=3198878 RepID=UPI003158B145